MRYWVALLALLSALSVQAEGQHVYKTTVKFIAVNGGEDSPNSGTTCIQVDSSLSDRCKNGYVGIRNNNQELLSAAMHAKATGNPIWFYYEDSDSNSNHCPGKVYTSCTVNSIGLW